jgi:hypothetical protein
VVETGTHKREYGKRTERGRMRKARRGAWMRAVSKGRVESGGW